MKDNFVQSFNKDLHFRKFGVDLIFWIATGYCAKAVGYFLPWPSCPPLYYAPSGDFADMAIEAGQTFCLSQYSPASAVILWIILSILRAAFLISKWQAGPLLKISGLKIQRRDGQPLRFGQAVRYAFLEWLPTGIGLGYILVFGMPANLTDSSNLGFIVLCIQLIWLAPIIFRYRGDNLFEVCCGACIAFTAKSAVKLTKLYQRKWRSRLHRFIRGIESFLYGVIAFLLLFIILQIIRTPPLDPNYQRLLYAGRDPVWENNTHIAMAGLVAPATVTDTYTYGLAKTYKNFKSFESMRQAAKLPYAYPVPDWPELLNKKYDDPDLALDDKDWKNLSCLYAIKPNDSKEPCADFNDLHAYIKNNQIIWNRFQAMINATQRYSIYQVPPQIMGGEIAHPLSLLGLESAHIIDLAQAGKTEEALQEWQATIHLLRLMAGAQTTMVYKAITVIAFNFQVKTLEKLLYLYPQLAQNHGNDIVSLLKPQEPTLFRAEYMLSDDAGMIDMAVLAGLGHTNAIRNDFYECILNWQNRAKMPIDQFFSQPKEKLCRLEEHPVRIILYAVLSPGNVISNIIASLLTGGELQGQDLVGNMKVFNVKLRLASLSVGILYRGIAAKDIPAFLSSVPADQQNPITRKPFDWDADAKTLFFILPTADAKLPEKDRRFEFHLNVQ